MKIDLIARGPGFTTPVPSHRGQGRASFGASTVHDCSRLRSERYGSRFGELAGEASEDAQVGVNLDALKATDLTP